MRLDPGALGATGTDQRASIPSIAQCRSGVINLQEEHVIAALKLAAAGEPLPDLESHRTDQAGWAADGVRLVVLAQRIRLLRHRQDTEARDPATNAR
jgi:hypothetical protein